MFIDSNRLSEVVSIIISTNGKYLGLVINKNPTWEDHIDYISHKIKKKLGFLRCIKSNLPKNASLIFYNSFIVPVFDYGDIIWGDRGNATLMTELQILFVQVAQIILDLPNALPQVKHLQRYIRISYNNKDEGLITELNLLTNHLITFSCTRFITRS